MNTSCVDCGTDISARQTGYAHPYLCSPCATTRNTVRERLRMRRRRIEHLDDVRRYQREWQRKRRVPIVRVIACEAAACGRTFTVHGRGTYHFCKSCSAFYDRERRLRSHRAWEIRYRVRENLKRRERYAKRLRRAA